MNPQIEIDPNKIHIYYELRKRRVFVGELIYKPNNDVYQLIYDKGYTKSKNAIPLGPNLDLFKTVHTSKKGELFPEFFDRIPEKLNPAYKDYCLSQGISPDEDNLIILLGTIGTRGASSFIFEKVYQNNFGSADITSFRKKLKISQSDLSTAFDIKKITLNRIEKGIGNDINTLKLLQIYFTFPEVALWQLKKSKEKMHRSVFGIIEKHFKSSLLQSKQKNLSASDNKRSQ